MNKIFKKWNIKIYYSMGGKITTSYFGSRYILYFFRNTIMNATKISNEVRGIVYMFKHFRPEGNICCKSS